jgi:hypothetical protein
LSGAIAHSAINLNFAPESSYHRGGLRWKLSLPIEAPKNLLHFGREYRERFSCPVLAQDIE